MIYAKVLPLLLWKHAVTGGAATAVGNCACRKAVKQMLYTVTSNLVTSPSKL